jgi:hypothetical protein
MFWVSGIPRPGGSKTAQAIYGRNGQPIMKGGRVLVTTRDAGGKKTENWRAVVAHEGRLAYHGDPLDCPLVSSHIFSATTLRSTTHRHRIPRSF